MSASIAQKPLVQTTDFSVHVSVPGAVFRHAMLVIDSDYATRAGITTLIDRESRFYELYTFSKFLNFTEFLKMPTEFYFDIKYFNLD